MCKTTIGYVHTVTTAAVEVKFYGEELDLMESAACAANKSLSEFANLPPKPRWNTPKSTCAPTRQPRQTSN